MKLSPLKWQYSEERTRETEKEREKEGRRDQGREERQDTLNSIPVSMIYTSWWSVCLNNFPSIFLLSPIPNFLSVH